MKYFLLVIAIISSAAHAQRKQTIDADCLRIKDGPCIDKDELGYLDGVTSSIQTQIGNGVTGPASSVNGEIVLFNSTTGKVIQRGTGTGYVKATSGVYSTSSTVAATDLTGILGLSNGGTAKNMSAVNGGVVWTDADSQEVSAAGTSGQYLKSNGAAAPTFSSIDISTSSVTGVLPLANGGSNKNLTAASGGMVYTDADSLEVTTAGSSGQFLKSNGTSAPTFSAVDISSSSVTGLLPLANGGGNKNLTAVAGGILYTDADSHEVTAAGSSGQFLKSNGSSAPTWATGSQSSDTILTPSTTNPVIYSAFINSTGTVSNEIGNLFNGNCTNANPSTCTFTSSIFATAPNCIATAVIASGSIRIAHFDAAPTTTGFSMTTTSAGALVAVDKMVVCHGLK